MTCEARVPGIVVGCAELVIVESWRADDAPTLSSTQKVGTSHLRRVRRISTNDCTRAESRCRNRSFIGSRTTQLVRTCLYSNNALQSTCNLQLLHDRGAKSAQVIRLRQAPHRPPLPAVRDAVAYGLRQAGGLVPLLLAACLPLHARHTRFLLARHLV